MTNEELVKALRDKCPIILDDPLHGVYYYDRIVRLEYSLADEAYSPKNSRDGIMVGVVLGDENGRSLIHADPRYIVRYSEKEYEERKRRFESI